MATPADRVYLVARALLDAVIDLYAVEAVELPERQYVSDGPSVAWDCEQLVVYVERTFPGLADLNQPQAVDTTGGVRSAALWVELVRCSAASEDNPLPDPDAIEANAQLVLADAVLIPNAIRAAYKANTLGCCHDVVAGEWQGLGPLSDLVGGRMMVTTQLTCDPTPSGS